MRNQQHSSSLAVSRTKLLDSPSASCSHPTSGAAIRASLEAREGHFLHQRRGQRWREEERRCCRLVCVDGRNRYSHISTNVPQRLAHQQQPLCHIAVPIRCCAASSIACRGWTVCTIRGHSLFRIFATTKHVDFGQASAMKPEVFEAEFRR